MVKRGETAVTGAEVRVTELIEPMNDVSPVRQVEAQFRRNGGNPPALTAPTPKPTPAASPSSGTASPPSPDPSPERSTS